MSSLNADSMRAYLGRSISSLNPNKLRGLLAEAELRRHLQQLGYLDRVSPGGWILRRVGAGTFGHDTVVIFPEAVRADTEYPVGRTAPIPPQGLHTICATFHQSGIHAFYCAAEVPTVNNPTTMTWKSIQLGIPAQQAWQDFPASMNAYFSRRERGYNFLRYNTDALLIPDSAFEEEFAKEHLRISFQTQYMSECSDVDGIFWGHQLTYPLEIKEKTPAFDRNLGEFFGLDVGPFVKLAFYAAKRANLHSLFIVREIDNVTDRNLVNWWFITFDQLAQYASWVQQAGGRGMGGGQSAVVKVPKAEFLPLDAAHLTHL